MKNSNMVLARLLAGIDSLTRRCKECLRAKPEGCRGCVIEELKGLATVARNGERVELSDDGEGREIGVPDLERLESLSNDERHAFYCKRWHLMKDGMGKDQAQGVAMEWVLKRI